MKKLIVILIVVPLLALIGYTAYVYEQAHSITGSVSVINNSQNQQTNQKYIPRIPTPSEFPEQPESPVPAAVQPYIGTWVVTSEIVGHVEWPAVGSQTYGVGKTIIIEPNLFENNSEMYPESMKNPEYTMIYPNSQDFQVSFPYIGDVGGPGGLGLYDGIATIAVNNHGVTPNPSPEYNFGTIYLSGGGIIVNSNGTFFRCVRQK
ncbi:MAG: hypothetical protein ACRDCW_05690 [Sarcina sp.]